MSTPTPPPAPPNLTELLAALATLRPQTPPQTADEKNLLKGASTIIGAIVLALCLWVGSSVNGLGTTVTRIAANIDAVQKSLSDLQATQSSTAQQLSDMKAVNAKQDARADAVDADLVRVKERMRIIEGQKPLGEDPTRPF